MMTKPNEFYNLAAMSHVGISFNTGADAYNNPSQLFGLKFLFSTLPSFFFISAIIIIWKYPITEELHAKIHDQLRNKNKKDENIFTSR